ncbi:RING-H2 zinc finger family protein [Candida albicans]|uniref:RING-H2 zinc finger family protein n=1 Tax=Candida albicans TaxID=5476 RepID=A0A8H6F775_CANAX|nr:RING-H2 zinc finger family protein [Candida albicans]
MADDQDRMDVDEVESKEPTTEPTTEPTSKPSSKPRFEVKKWTAKSLMEPCIECQPNAMGNIPSEECIPAWGVCNHAFHLHCIRRWLKTRNACPLDSTNWTYQKLGN